MSKEEPRWATVATAAGYMDSSTKFIRALIARGELTGYRIGTRSIRVDLRELDSVMKPIPSADLENYTKTYQKDEDEE